MKIPFVKIEIGETERRLLTQVLDSGWLTTAGMAAEFEKQFAAKVGATHALAVNSCTAGLHLALEAIGVGPGDKVIVPSMTFTATAEIVRYLGADPVIVDTERRTDLMTPEVVEATLKAHPEVKAVIPVHFGGQSVELFREGGGGIQEICQKHGVRVIHDAAHSFPAAEQGRPIGSIGDITCFSFYANKTITTGEGGMVTTEDDELAARMKVMRLHGINRDVWDRFQKGAAKWEYDVVAPGYKYNMSDVAAAIGLGQLERADEFRDGRVRCARIYNERLADHDGVAPPRSRVAEEDHAWHIYPVTMTEAAAISRNEMIEQLSARDIGVSVHYKPLHRLRYYRETYDLSEADFPNAEWAWQGRLTLPLYPALTDEGVHYVCDTFLSLLTG